MTPQPEHLSAQTLADLGAELLTPAERAAAERHLVGCATCRAQRAALSDVSAELRAAAWRDPIPADVATRVEAALQREGGASREPAVAAARSTRRRPAWLPRVAGAVAALSVVVAGVGYVAGTAANDGSPQGDRSAAESMAEPDAGAPAQDAAAAESAVATATRELAASGAAAPPSPAAPESGAAEQQGRQNFTASCGQLLAQELGRALVAATPYTYAGRDAILIVVSGPSAELVTGYVLPYCEAGAADAYVSVDVPRE
jgi:hypothetical protein